MLGYWRMHVCFSRTEAHEISKRCKKTIHGARRQIKIEIKARTDVVSNFVSCEFFCLDEHSCKTKIFYLASLVDGSPVLN